MLKKDKIRLAIIAAIIIAAALTVFPIQGRVKLGLDLRGGAHIVLQAKGSPENPLGEDSLDRLVTVLRNRVDQYGIVEPQIQREGADRIAIDLPGVDDPESALELIGRTAVLQFRQVVGTSIAPPPKVERKNYSSDEAYNRAQENWNGLNAQFERDVASFQEKAKEDPSVFVGRDEDGRVYTLGEVYVMGGDLSDARMTRDELGKPAVSISFNRDGAAAFEKATEANIGSQIAIVLDDSIISAPTVRSKISGEGRITGNFTEQEAALLATMLRAGALPVEVEVIENRSVGPTLGEDSIHSGLRSGLIGASLVAVFMLIYYGMLGIAADMALATAMLVLMAVVVLLRTTLTLPGIGGIILTIGMAVDGNILIYERMKEEYRSGKTILAALDAGFRKALVVILDSNVTTLIAAGVLFYFGSGPIRGFAVTLSLGVVTAMFGNIVVTRALLQIMLRHRKAALFDIFGSLKFSLPFMKYRRAALFLSLFMVFASLFFLATKGVNYSVDFSGGVAMQLEFANPVDVGEIRDAISGSGQGQATIQAYDERNVLVRYQESGETARSAILKSLEDKFGAVTLQKIDEVGPVVGLELRRQAAVAISLSIAAILAYMAFRFRFRFGVAAVLALVHDSIIMLGVYSFTGREISTSFIAAILTVIGYSLNDSIVVLDRVREDWSQVRRIGVTELVSNSINKTLSRTINTSLTTLLPVLAMFFLGGEVISNLAFAFLVGIAVGTYSSIYTASALIAEWYLRKPEKR
ncbi:MAG: protein translocase subunit SecD [Synergistaceae bacterium]|jgi:preprotein translocase subunit SecD|nr:protein translocase subunit SecD [Synergistaceae bacterium]